MKPETQESAPCFTAEKKIFENEEAIKEPLPFDDNGTPIGDKIVTIRHGLGILTWRSLPPMVQTEVNMSVIGFAFHLSGKQEATVERGMGKKPVSILNQRGVNTVIGLHGANLRSQHLSHESMDAVIVYVARREFTDIIAREMDGIPRDFCTLLQQKNLFFTLPMTREMYNVAAQALYHPYQGSASRFHLQGCGLELLAMQIDQFSKQDIHREKPLLRADQERIRMAGDILVKNMKNPPTIPALASQVGVNTAKLQRGFKQVFGTTVNKFLLQHRMNCARELILNQKTDVAQAAFSVGYADISHFIHCYKKTFGVTPGYHKQNH